MKTILAPIDFSGATDAVVEEAAALARSFSGRVVLLTIIQPPVIAHEYAAVMENLAEITAAGEKQAARKLGELEQKLQVDLIAAESVQLLGSPIALIVEQAKKVCRRLYRDGFARTHCVVRFVGGQHDSWRPHAGSVSGRYRPRHQEREDTERTQAPRGVGLNNLGMWEHRARAWGPRPFPFSIISGFLFITLEDETGTPNAIVNPALFEQERFVINLESALVITGRLQNEQGVIHVMAESIVALPRFEPPTAASHDYR